jgi:hypothetical protein
MKVKIDQNKEIGKFQLNRNNEKYFLNLCEKSSNTLEYYSTFVLEKYRGQRLANQLANEALNYAQKNNLKVIPTCSFVNTFAKENCEFDDVIVSE